MVGQLETLFDQLEEKIDSMEADEMLDRERKADLVYEERKRRFTELLKKFQEQVCRPLGRSYGVKLDDQTDATIYSGGITVHTRYYTDVFCPKEKIESERLTTEEFVRKHGSNIYTMEEVTNRLLGYIHTPQSMDGTDKTQPIF